jgi:dihydropyrimidinase
MSDLSGLKTRILIHCEDDATVEEYSDKHPFRHPFQHSLRRPEAAEIIAVERVLDLAARHKHPVHIVHVSSPRSALLIQQARETGVAVTCETAPHYLLLNDEAYYQEKSHRLICTPPFRSESSRGMLVELLQDGLFDLVASDHCAFTLEDKDRHQDEPELVPCGIPGIQTLFSSLHQALVQTGKLKLEKLLELTSETPARLMGLSELSKNNT